MSIGTVTSAQPQVDRLRSLLHNARKAKQASSIEPPLTASDTDTSVLLTSSPETQEAGGTGNVAPAVQASLVETAATSLFYDLVASSNIDDPAFVKIWNLLDILQIAADNGQCDPGLALRLIEELLDSQTINGCRKVFDYLDSRRDRLVAKDWNRKYLIVLRTCNQLLRRLSRAEDADFCGRVFFFLFQSFPLGDRSSVNLRGEFHTENVTTFDTNNEAPRRNIDSVDVDMEVADGNSMERAHDVDKSDDPPDATATANEAKPAEIAVKPTSSADTKSVDADSLYPIFWGLQKSFSNPVRLFERTAFEEFKDGLDLTVSKFKEIPKVIEATSGGKHAGVKRKRGSDQDTCANTHNPKYLTSRELFDLELSDLAFQRHVLVQALIIINFLLSLSTRAKAKQANIQQPNKAVVYNHTLSDDDILWAVRAKQQIAGYLKEGPEGNFYYRMVDNVLSRDKNWVRWKLESCPPITKNSVSVQEYMEAKAGAREACSNKKLGVVPSGTLDLSFLADTDGVNGLEQLKTSDKYNVPAPESYIRSIERLDLDLEMAMNDDEKRSIEELKASQKWKALRIASRVKLKLFDKLDDGKNLGLLLDEPSKSGGQTGVPATGATDVKDTLAPDTDRKRYEDETKRTPVPDSPAVREAEVVS